MADIAIGRPCPRCGTLTAISGAFSEPMLHGTCASCGYMVSATAFGGERAHAIRAAGIPSTSQGAPAPVVPSFVPVVGMTPLPAAAVVATASANAPAPVSAKRGNEKSNEAA